MNKKFLMAAMALPMLFTACSQDEYLEDFSQNANLPDAKGYYVTLAPTLGDVVNSRANWLDANAKLEWDETDKISVYWLGATEQTEALTGKFNSIFKTEDGKAFTSESMVFLGGNVAVYPGNTNFVKEGLLKVYVPYNQDENTIKSTPYISNYITITEPKEGQESQLPGYNNGLYSPMKLGANVLYLDVELANTANLAQYNFKVDSISLVSTTDKFAKEAEIAVSGADPFDKGEVTYKDGSDAGTDPDILTTINKSLCLRGTAESTTLTAKSVTDKGNGKYQAKFVVLPTVMTGVAASDANTMIVIYTNCGRIELKTTKTVVTAGVSSTSNEYAYVAPAADATNITWAGLVTGAKDAEGEPLNQTIADLVEQIRTSHFLTEDVESNFKGERIGKPFARSIKADMANATLDNSIVKNSEEIKNYVSIYTAMKSVKPMNLILSADEGSVFKSLTKEAIAAVDAKNTYAAQGVTEKINVTLSMNEGMDAVQIVGGGAVYFNKDKQWKDQSTQVKMILEAGKNWTMDDKYNFNHVSEIINNATLTIAGTVSDDNKQNTLNEKVVNNGTLKISGNKLQVGTNLQNVSYEDDDITINGTVEIANGQNLVFNKDVTEGIEGTINVAQGGFLTIAANKSVVSEAEINNYGLVSAEDGNGGLINKGIINVKRDLAITYVQDNKDGVINLMSRNNEAVVKTNKGKIVYDYKSATDGTTFVRNAADKFTYVVFGEGNSQITLATLNQNVNGVNALGIEDLSMKFTDETNLVTNGLHFETLEVAAGAHLQVLSGNTVEVHHLINNGIITVGGTINYLNTYDKAANATVYSVGQGAIVYNAATVNTVDDVKKAIVAGKDVILSNNLSLTEADLEGAENITIQGASENLVLTITAKSKTAVFENGVNFKNLTVEPMISVDNSFGNKDVDYETMPVFKGNSTFENVEFTYPIIIAGNAEFENVEFTNEKNSYSIWIAPLGQTVSMNNCTINAVRGINVTDAMEQDHQTLGTKKSPILNISKTSFTTSGPKAAIMVRDCGAVINLTNVNITAVNGDNTNAAWLDEDATCDMEDIEINGGTCKEEK